MTYKSLKKMLANMSKEELKQEAIVVDPNDEAAPVIDIVKVGGHDGPAEKGQLILKSGRII